jgi:pyruvate dehydrogenase E2 component (dihydrolipoamide acetyltransferase)
VGELKTVLIPDIGDFSAVPVIEVFVQNGDQVNAEDPLIALESDKATIDIPAPFTGLIREIRVKPGDKVSEGSPIAVIEIADSSGNADTESVSRKPDNEADSTEKNKQNGEVASEKAPRVITHAAQAESNENVIKAEVEQIYPASPLIPPVPVDVATAKAHAGPSVRRFARELGVNLDLITGSGPKYRILKEDVQAFVKAGLSRMRANGKSAPVETGLDLLPWPQVDFARHGPVEIRSLSRIKQIAGANLHRNWVMIPHVTQFDEADITDLEALRKESNTAEKQNAVKLTLLSFLMKALIASLKKFPEFNASLDKNANGETNLIIKRYYHIGFAVDTVNGLVVPVIRDVDQKGVVAIARELSELSALARENKLKPEQMQGAGFTISSLGGIGGTAFTPIINAPEVAILGVSKADYKPVYRDGKFVPRLVLPLSLSYDHRVIDGAAAARFTAHLAEVLTDMRLALL